MRLLAIALLAAISLAAGLSGCELRAEPDWQELYTQRLGRQVAELDEATLDRDYLDPASGALTRAAWAKLRDGSTVFLGLPAHDLGREEVVERTVVLWQREWQDACREGLGENEIWGWEMNHAHPGNSLPIYVNNRRDAFCEFVFLPEGWELRTVKRHPLQAGR